ncbi:hypothetical protein E2562_034943 [Oryza meyeriana var. granulata]|uniref:PTBP1-like RNA recognition motif 2 domain-containing protein n=1 Tax=Oryza meyeriana var. granulata TaxID=110450 RepID=A0A6G1DC56_9ORYZ|nr:hypothetical protein E2562_034943 [Oryza meyeriana var. granulata]
MASGGIGLVPESCDAERAWAATHGRNIDNGGCLLDVQHAQPCLGYGSEVTPTKCSTFGLSCSTTKPAATCVPSHPQPHLPKPT